MTLIALITKNTLPLILISSFFLFGGCLTTDTAQTIEETPVNNQEKFLIGTYTNDSSEGVYKISLNSKKQLLINEGIVATAVNPSYLVLSKDQSTLYAATGDDSGGIDRFAWNTNLKKYELRQQIKGLGKWACHIALNPQENQLAIANYGTGDVHLFAIESKNNLLSEAGYFKNTGSGPSARQTQSHMHFVSWGNEGKYLYAIDLGTDEIKVFNSNNKSFVPEVAAKLRAGDGPRHLVFHPKKPWVYVVNELTNSVAVFTQNKTNGKLIPIQYISIIDEKNNEQPIESISSAIKISNDGRFIYAAIRGINKLAVLRVSNTGKVKLIQHHTTLGDWPRDITISANQNYILIANQRSNTINVLKRDTETGLLTSTEMILDISIPSYIGVFN